MIALGARVLYVLEDWHYAPFLQDARSYNLLASRIAGGHGWPPTAYRAPGYPFFLAFVYKLVGIPPPLYVSAGVPLRQIGNPAANQGAWVLPRLVEALLATATVGLIGWLTHQLAGRRTALVAMAVAAVYLPLTAVGVSLMSEALVVPLSLVAAGAAIRARTARHRTRWIVLAGLFAGLTALTRANGFVVGIALAFVVWNRRPRWAMRSIGSPALLLAIMVLTIAPWTVRNAVTLHAFVPVSTELGATLSGTYNDFAAQHDFKWTGQTHYHNYWAVRHNKKLSETQRDNELTTQVLAYIGNHPTYVLQAMFWNTVRLLDLEGRRVSRFSAYVDVGASHTYADLSVYEFWLVGILAIAALFTGALRMVPRALWLVPFLIWLSEAPLIIGTPRFRAALDPWIILLASITIVALARRGLIWVRRPAQAPNMFSDWGEEPFVPQPQSSSFR